MSADLMMGIKKYNSRMGNQRIKLSSTLNELVIVTGLCPLLGAVTNFQAGLVMAILFALAFIVLAIMVSATRHLLPVKVRLVVIVSLSATVVTVLHMILQAFFYEQSLLLGIYGYLIAVSALVLVFAREEWCKLPVTASIKQAVIMSLVVTALLVIIGATRDFVPLQLLTEPAGAFITLALLLAIIRWFGSRPAGGKSDL